MHRYTIYALCYGGICFKVFIMAFRWPGSALSCSYFDIAAGKVFSFRVRPVISMSPDVINTHAGCGMGLAVKYESDYVKTRSKFTPSASHICAHTLASSAHALSVSLSVSVCLSLFLLRVFFWKRSKNRKMKKCLICVLVYADLNRWTTGNYRLTRTLLQIASKQSVLTAGVTSITC